MSKVRYFLFLLKEETLLFYNAFVDTWRYRSASFTGFSRRSLNLGRLEGRLMATYHVLEKGLAMPEMRPRFGIPVVKRLQEQLQEYNKLTRSCGSAYVYAAKTALEEYQKKHESIGVDVSDLIFLDLSEKRPSEFKGGVFEGGSNFFDLSNAPFPQFARSRHSSRRFKSDVRVSLDVVIEAIKIAKSTPSACNRQPWKVYSYRNKDKISSIMELHQGSRGFGADLPMLLIVTCRMDTYSGIGERNQTYVDGGLFAMTLMFAFHYLKIGAVPLNWSVDRRSDRKIKERSSIPDDENIIMLIGAGHTDDSSLIPHSQRREACEILIDSP